jgi:hypothetical protein
MPLLFGENVHVTYSPQKIPTINQAAMSQTICHHLCSSLSNSTLAALHQLFKQPAIKLANLAAAWLN